MTRLISSIILIGISIAVFIMLSNPFYNEITQLRAKASSFDEALTNSKALETARDELTTKENNINLADREKLHKLLPDNVDNIPLILQIGQVAEPYGMVLKDIKYNETTTTPQGTQGALTTNTGATPSQSDVISSSTSGNYGIWNLSFSTTGTYRNFLSFTEALQKNLRIVDISSIQFSSDTTTNKLVTGTVSTDPLDESYRYDFKIKTYYLKN